MGAGPATALSHTAGRWLWPGHIVTTPRAPRPPPGAGAEDSPAGRCPVSPQLQTQGLGPLSERKRALSGNADGWEAHEEAPSPPQDARDGSTQLSPCSWGRGDTLEGQRQRLPERSAQARGGGLPASPRSHPAPQPRHLEPERLAAGTQGGPACPAVTDAPVCAGPGGLPPVWAKVCESHRCPQGEKAPGPAATPGPSAERGLDPSPQVNFQEREQGA